ncbi:MAG: DUF86 domain-containing protein [Chloroflexota bacterium]|nr:DUF86 domain-containing protein [Chloroflexota bacterium]
MVMLARRITSRLQGLRRENFDADEDLQLALTHLIQNLGEAASRTSQEFRAIHPEIPWSDMIGMRHHIVHDYLQVSADIVWATALDDIPALIAVLEPLVTSEDSEED